MTSNVKSVDERRWEENLVVRGQKKMGRLRLVVTGFFWIYLMNVSGDIGQSRTSG